MTPRLAILLQTLQADAEQQHTGPSAHLAGAASIGEALERGQQAERVSAVPAGDPVVMVVLCELVDLLQAQRWAGTPYVRLEIGPLHGRGCSSPTRRGMRLMSQQGCFNRWMTLKHQGRVYG